MSSTPSFTELGLSPEILRAVAEAGYTIPTPIQAQAIPTILAGKDVMGGAQTGTGKTAGFTLPILQKLLPMANTSPSPARHPIRALILTPTRELASQDIQPGPVLGQVMMGLGKLTKQTEEPASATQLIYRLPEAHDIRCVFLVAQSPWQLDEKLKSSGRLLD